MRVLNKKVCKKINGSSGVYKPTDPAQAFMTDVNKKPTGSKNDQSTSPFLTP